MFTLSINTGIELTDLLNLKVKDVKDKLYLKILNTKTVPLNNELIELINIAIDGKKDLELLFNGIDKKPLNRASAYHIFKNICNELGLKKEYSVASWRKTFAYHHYNKYNDLSFLMWFFNQCTAQQALKFIDVEENMNLRFKEGVCL